VSGKTIHDYLPLIWSRLARSYDPGTRQMVPAAALDLVVSHIYHKKFERHSEAGPLLSVLNTIGGSQKLAPKTRGRLPTAETLHCTVRNVNWLLRYWQFSDYPDPVQPEFGFARDKRGVRFEA
jgi:acyl carrier protein phosphodiesterase